MLVCGASKSFGLKAEHPILIRCDSLITLRVVILVRSVICLSALVAQDSLAAESSWDKVLLFRFLLVVRGLLRKQRRRGKTHLLLQGFIGLRILPLLLLLIAITAPLLKRITTGHHACWHIVLVFTASLLFTVSHQLVSA